MAITWVETDVVYGSSPTWKRCIGWEQIARDGSSATFRVYLKLKVNSSGGWYGYPLVWNITGSTQSSIKGNEKWYGSDAYRQFTKDVKISVGGAGGTHSLEVAVWGSSDSGANFNKRISMSYSTWNTAPTWSSSARLRVRKDNSSGTIISQEIDGVEDAIKIPENWGTFYVYWDSATDKENNINKYELYYQEDNGSWSRIYSGGNRYFTHNVASGSATQGKRYDYYVQAVDSYGAISSNLNVVQFQKNQLTGATLSSSSSITYSSSSISVSWSGAKNTYNNTSFTYKLSSSDITIYNPNVEGSSATISIYKSGTVPTTPYIKFDDLKSKFSSSNYIGTINLTLTTTNAYGSSATSSKAISVNLQTNPKAPTSITIEGKVSTSLGSYIIPDRANPTVTWSGASDYLGGKLTYDVYYKYGTGSEVLVTSNTPNTSISMKLPTVTSATALTVKVVARTSFGATSSSSNSGETVHHYSAPTVSLTNANRTITSFTVDINSKINSSLPNIAYEVQQYQKGTDTAVNFTGNKFTASLTGLGSEDTFDFKATVNDNSGLSSNQVATYKVTPTIPKFSVRENGVGVNCINDGSKGVFNVEGNSYLNGTLEVNGVSKASQLNFTGDTENKARIGYSKSDSCTYITNANGNWFRLDDDGRVSWRGNPVQVYSKTNNSTHFGLNVGDGTENGWIRVPASGLLPNKANGDNTNGGSNLGTSDWRFNGIWSREVNALSKITANNTVIDSKGVVFEDNSCWKSIDFKRTVSGTTQSARFGIGSNAGGASPSIEFHNNATADSLKYRLDLNPTHVALISHQTDQSNWVGFYSGGNTPSCRYGYIGRGSNDNSNINLFAEKGSLILRTAYSSSSSGVCLDTSGYMRPETSNGWSSGSGSYRWSTVYYTNLNSPSDERLKENISYIKTGSTKTKNSEVVAEDFYNFVKDDLALATYDYKASKNTPTNEIDKLSNKIGFIAQDIKGTKVGDLFIKEDIVEVEPIAETLIDTPTTVEEDFPIPNGETTLSYDLTDYVNILAGALKVAINKVEELTRKVEDLSK